MRLLEVDAELEVAEHYFLNQLLAEELNKSKRVVFSMIITAQLFDHLQVWFLFLLLMTS